MRLLLDTHTLFWADSDPAKLSTAAATAIRDPANEILISVVSVWEMAIKGALGKLHLRLPLADIIAAQQANGMLVLPRHAGPCPRRRRPPASPQGSVRPPADRPGAGRRASLLTADPLIAPYPVIIVW